MPAEHLYQKCPMCGGTGWLPPDTKMCLDAVDGIPDLTRLPDGNYRCVGCLGERYVRVGVTVRQLDRLVQQASAPAMPQTDGPPIVAAWRAGGSEAEIGHEYLAVLVESFVVGRLRDISTFERDGEHLVLDDLAGHKYDWEDVAWFVPIDEIAPTRGETDG